jgi:hypothetical protein
MINNWRDEPPKDWLAVEEARDVFGRWREDRDDGIRHLFVVYHLLLLSFLIVIVVLRRRDCSSQNTEQAA